MPYVSRDNDTLTNSYCPEPWTPCNLALNGRVVFERMFEYTAYLHFIGRQFPWVIRFYYKYKHPVGLVICCKFLPSMTF